MTTTADIPMGPDRFSNGITVTDQEALSAIERICGDDFCEYLDMRDMDETTNADLRTAHRKLSAVYRIAHSLVTGHVCFEVHSDWRKGAEETVNALVRE